MPLTNKIVHTSSEVSSCSVLCVLILVVYCPLNVIIQRYNEVTGFLNFIQLTTDSLSFHCWLLLLHYWQTVILKSWSTN